MEDALELPLVEDQQMVEAFLPHTSQEAFTDSIGSWGMNRRFEDLDRARFRYTSKARPELAIVITNQILRRLPIGSGLSQLLRHPGIGRRACDANMDDLASFQFDEKEGKERPKEQIGDLQEITGPDRSCMVAQKGLPLLTSWLLGANCPHILLDRPLAHSQAQFQQFSTNALSSPEPIVLRHLPDQGDRFRGYHRLVGLRLGLALPVQAKELPMPSEQGVWLHDHESLLPGTNQPGQ